MNEDQVEGIVETSTEEKTSVGLPFKVVLYNDEIHTFDEVIIQLIKAVGCTFVQARSYAFEVHVKGKAIVYNGNLPMCLKPIVYLYYNPAQYFLIKQLYSSINAQDKALPDARSSKLSRFFFAADEQIFLI